MINTAKAWVFNAATRAPGQAYSVSRINTERYGAKAYRRCRLLLLQRYRHIYRRHAAATQIMRRLLHARALLA